MSAAGLVSFALGEAMGLAQTYWAVLTAVIVTQASVGGSLKASVDRVVGTIGGAAWGVAVAVAVPHPGVVSTGGALAVTLVPLSALAAFRPAYRVATVTGAIVLLGRFGQIGIVTAALDRVFEISLGSVIALAVAMLVSPARARGFVGAAARDALAAMGDLAAALLGDIGHPPDAPVILALNDRIRQAIERAVTAADEAARERRLYVTDTPDQGPLVRCLRRLSHDLVMVARTLALPLPPAVAERLTAPAAAVGATLSDYLTECGRALVGRPPPVAGPVDAALDAFQQAIGGLRQEGLTRSLSGAEVERVFGLSFGLEQMRRNLDDLAGHAEAAPRKERT